MSRPREVIDSYMEEVLFKLVSQSIRNMPAEDAADAAKKLRAFEDFNRDIVSFEPIEAMLRNNLTDNISLSPILLLNFQLFTNSWFL